MQTHVRIGIALAIVALTATDAAAQALKKYGSEAGWDIFIKEDMGPGCVVAKKINADAQVEMGISATGERKGYIALYTKKRRCRLRRGEGLRAVRRRRSEIQR